MEAGEKNMDDIRAGLTRGDRVELARRLACHPSKITLALDGLVKSQDFIDKMKAEADAIIRERQAEATM